MFNGLSLFTATNNSTDQIRALFFHLDHCTTDDENQYSKFEEIRRFLVKMLQANVLLKYESY